MRSLISKYVTGLLAVALCACCFSSASAVVSVKGHYRNGSWVQPHHRSNPDGIFSNNWSTVGNRNPYTGKWGTIRNPPAGYGGSRNRSRSYGGATVLANRVDNFDKSETSYAEDIKAFRDRQGERFSKLDIQRTRESKDVRVDFSDDERDRHSRLQADLQNAGVNLNWRIYTPDRLDAMKERIELAERVANFGLDIPWQMRTLEQWQNLERHLLAADAAELRQIIAENTGSEGLWWQQDR